MWKVMFVLGEWMYVSTEELNEIVLQIGAPYYAEKLPESA